MPVRSKLLVHRRLTDIKSSSQIDQPPSQTGVTRFPDTRRESGSWSVGDTLPAGSVLGLFGPEEPSNKSSQLRDNRSPRLRRIPVNEQPRPRLRAVDRSVAPDVAQSRPSLPAGTTTRPVTDGRDTVRPVVSRAQPSPRLSAKPVPASRIAVTQPGPGTAKQVVPVPHLDSSGFKVT